MSKNVNVNGQTYSGISQVKLNTTSGGTALFKDVDEITTPSGTKAITENGTYDVSDFATAQVNVPAGGGSGVSTNYFNMQEVVIEANSVANTWGVIKYFREKLNTRMAIAILKETPATENQVVTCSATSVINNNDLTEMTVNAGNVTRYKTAQQLALSVPTGTNYDAVLVEGTTYYVFYEA